MRKIFSILFFTIIILFILPTKAKAFSYDISTYPFTTQYDSYLYDDYNIKPEIYLNGVRADLTDVSSYVSDSISRRYLSSYLNVTYSNNKEVGTGIITITGESPFYGTKTISFSIIDTYTDKYKNKIKIGKTVDTSTYSTDYLGNTVMSQYSYKKDVTLLKYGNSKVTYITTGSFPFFTKFNNNYNIGGRTYITISIIDSNAFKKCKNIKQINFYKHPMDEYNKSNLTIKSNAFANKKKLKTISFYKWQVDIEKNAFKGCGSLESIVIKNAKYIPTVGKNAFKGCSKNIVIKCPKGAKSKVKKAFKKAGLPKTAKFVY